MSFSISSIAGMSTQLNQIQAVASQKSQASSAKSKSPMASLLQQTNQLSDKAEEKLTQATDKEELNARMITNTMDSVAKPFSQNFSNAYSDSYNLNKEVLGAFADFYR